MRDESVSTSEHFAPAGSDLLPSADVFDPVIEAYKKDVDRTLLRENLKLSPQQRSEKFVSFMKSIQELRRVAARELGR